MATLRDLSKQTLEDLQHGRHREAYALFLIGVVLVVLSLIGVADTAVMLSAILLALSFLVFHTAAEAPNEKPALDQVLYSRQDFDAFSKLLPGVRDLRSYGPTGVNVLVNSADIRRFVLDSGGTVRSSSRTMTQSTSRRSQCSLTIIWTCGGRMASRTRISPNGCIS